MKTKIFKTNSGAIYIIETLEHCDSFGYHTKVGYHVVRFEPNVTEPVMDETVDDYFIDGWDHINLVKDHVKTWSSTSIAARV